MCTRLPLGLFWLLLACSCTPAPSARENPAAQARAGALVTSAPAASYRPPDAQGWGEAAGLRYLEIVSGAADPNTTLPLVIVIHGLGDKPSRDWLNVIDVRTPARLILPQAPTPFGNGFAWFDYDANHQEPQHLAKGIRAAADKLAKSIEVLAARRATRGRSVVTGFSQGGMLSYALALLYPELVSFALPISGMLPEPLWPKQPKPAEHFPAITALHGDADQIVPLLADRQTRAALSARGYPAELEVYPGVQHAISAEMVQTIRDTLTRELLTLER